MKSRYLADIRELGGWRLVRIWVLSLATAATEGIGLLLLVPLLELIGGDKSGSSIGRAIQSALESVGIKLTLVWALTAYIVLLTIRALLVRARDLGALRFQLEFVDWERMRLFDAVARADWLFHVRRRDSDLLHTLAADIARIGQGTSALVNAASRLIMCGVYIVVAVRLSPAMTALAVGISVTLAAMMVPLVRRSRQLGALQTTTWRRSYGELTEFLSGIKLSKSHGTEAKHVEEFDRSLTDVRDAKIGFQRTRSLASSGYQVATGLATAGLVWIGFERMGIPGAQLIVLIMVFSRIMPVAGSLLGDLQDTANMLPAYASAIEVLDEAVAAKERVSAEDHPPLTIRTGVRLEGVTFEYPEMSHPALDAVHLVIPARQTTALVGHSGAGKTTFADVVLGLLSPTSGTVTVDGQPLEEIDLAAWRATVSYVPQDPYLFHDTLRANVAWASHGRLVDDEILELLELASLGDLVAGLPDGLDSVVGDRGLRLSGGERQRVVMARALARRPSLLVLDEATSSLDVNNERAVQAAIDGLHGNLTVLLIAHRLSTIRRADQIVVLDRGRVCEIGTWDELVAKGGRFAAMLAADGSEPVEPSV